MKRLSAASIPTPWGTFDVITYAESESDRMPHLAIAHPELDPKRITTVRVHSECFTGDVLGSKRCDCGAQLHRSLELVDRDRGVLLYLRQEGRGIGLTNKLLAYNLQDKGMDTVSANHQLGFEADERTYDIASQMLTDLGIQQIRLLTNNPLKVESLRENGIEIVERVPIKIEPSKENAQYLQTKKDLMGHILD